MLTKELVEKINTQAEEMTASQDNEGNIYVRSGDYSPITIPSDFINYDSAHLNIYQGAAYLVNDLVVLGGLLKEYAATPLDKRTVEPHWRVLLNGFNSDNGRQYLTCSKDNHRKIFACARNKHLKQEFTQKELKKIDEKAVEDGHTAYCIR